MKRLVLFDIDGTLLTTNGRAVQAMMAAYRRVYGREAADLPYRMDGKTELQITLELMTLAGVAREEVIAGLPRFWPHYAEELEQRVTPDTTTVHPGVAEVVAAVGADPDCVLGLLTGNCRFAARKKLECAGLDGFVVGAYGELHERRDELPAVAREAARRITGRRYSGKEIVILGDTPNDIACGRALGVKAIAVATGRFAPEELAGHEPDAVFPTFADVPAVLRAIRSE
jgi:phosphoglycolate phosphatase-like HAD superfamily hydrolase